MTPEELKLALARTGKLQDQAIAKWRKEHPLRTKPIAGRLEVNPVSITKTLDDYIAKHPNVVANKTKRRNRSFQ